MRPTSRSPKRILARAIAISSAVGMLGILSACSSESTGPGANTSSQLMFTAGGTGSTSDASPSTVPITKDGHTLDLTAVTLTVARAELKRVKTDICATDAEDDDDHRGPSFFSRDCRALKVGPTTVDLPLDGSVVTIPANTIPAGTFSELELRLAYVRLRGTFDTKPFDVTLFVNVKGEVEFATPLVVKDSQPVAVTVNLPVATWLVNADGSLVDPNKISTTPSLMSLVKHRIASTVRAFEDRDHDGKDDHRGRD